jgi:protoporphyrinogen IX oxidase
MVLWLKALHIIGVIAWMAGMLYLPRLFVYHVDAPTGSVQSETFKVMERRLLRGILNPSCLVVFVTGPVLGYMTGYWQSPWLQIKIAPVLALAILHAYFAVFVRAFASDENYHSARFFRIINEAPALLMVAIVILAAVKPF